MIAQRRAGIQHWKGLCLASTTTRTEAGKGWTNTPQWDLESLPLTITLPNTRLPGSSHTHLGWSFASFCDLCLPPSCLEFKDPNEIFGESRKCAHFSQNPLTSHGAWQVWASFWKKKTVEHRETLNLRRNRWRREILRKLHLSDDLKDTCWAFIMCLALGWVKRQRALVLSFLGRRWLPPGLICLHNQINL